MTLVLLGDAHGAVVVTREAEGVARQEDVLRDMLFDNPAMLPVVEIDPGYGRLVAIAKELYVPGVGRIDALFADEHGRLVIVECKLWRNPQAKREVVGQILHYASELARFSYDILQRQISSATKRPGNVLYELLRDAGFEIEESRLVDQVSRDLARGRFLLLIVGDGITHGTNSIGEFLNEHAGLAFDFAMIEMAQYRFQDPLLGVERTIVQPRIIAKTELIERFVIRNEATGIVIQNMVETSAIQPPSGGSSSEAVEQWKSMVERFTQRVRFDDPSQPPPRYGGIGWMRVPLPGPSHLTLWRGKGSGTFGGFITYKGSEGLVVFDELLGQRDAIDQEFADNGLPLPEWKTDGTERSIMVRWASPFPWAEPEEERQMTLMAQAANQFVNSLRSRLSQRPS